MSERDPRGGGRRPDHDEPPPWPEGPGSSVFDRPAAPRPPDRRSYVPPPPPADPATLPTQQWPEALYPDQGRYAPPDQGRYAPPPGDGRYAPPGRGAYAPPGHGGYAPPDQGGYAPPDRGPYAPPREARAPSGRRSPGDPAGGRRGGRSDADADGGGRDRSGGRGFPLGLGALVGVAGLGCFLAALIVLPWFVVTIPGAGDQEVRLEDIRSSFTVAETDPDDLLPDADAGAEPGATTLPDGIPTPDELGEAAEDQARDIAATAAASAVDEGKARYLELYADTLWMVVAGAVVLAVVFSTILSPRSFALSLLLGFRRAAGAVTVLAGAAHGAALWVVFSGTGAPTPLWGVWLGVAGLAGVLLGCVIGPKG